ncbi:MAG: ABC transporter permease [Maioricimonas sp. JB045]|uniref:ABC transporter permease n=1 Tax=Maioricimonas sp. JC845 TaxID=3232138 RepID=UPI003457BDA8
MSAVTSSLQWFARVGDLANPILVKETRQAFKSRQFVITFMLMLLACWLTSVFGLMLAGNAIEFGAVGTRFFSFYFYILAFAAVVVIPFNAYRSLLTEREQSTYELLSITCLSPRQIVSGKLLSALVQVFIFYAAITPFIAFTSLLQGFDIVDVVFMLLAALIASVMASSAALMVSAVAQQRLWQALSSMAVLFGLVSLFSMMIGILEEARGEVDFQDSEFWWATVTILLGAASYFLLFQQIAIAQLTFASDNRSTGIRLVCAGQLVLLWGCLMAHILLSPHSAADLDGLLIFGLTLSAVHCTVVGLFSVTEEDYLSRRVRRNLPHSRLLRLLVAPLLPGGSRGFLYLLALVAGYSAFSLFIASWASPRYLWVERAILASGCYIIFYLGVGTAMSRWLFALSSDIRPAHSRVFIVLLFAAGCIAPFLPFLFGMRNLYGYRLWMISNPIPTLDHISNRGVDSDAAIQILAVAALLAIALNLRGIQRGLAEAVSTSSPPPPPADQPAEPATAV